MSGHRLIAFQIELLDFSRRNNGHYSDAVVLDTRGIYLCQRCGWEGQREDKCPKCGEGLYPKGRVKVVDRKPIAPRRTKIGLFYNIKGAKKWGRKFGTVISCHKVDKSPYLKNIEYLNLKQEPLTIELVQEDYVLNKALELERPKKRFDNGGINIEIRKELLDKE